MINKSDLVLLYFLLEKCQLTESKLSKFKHNHCAKHRRFCLRRTKTDFDFQMQCLQNFCPGFLQTDPIL